MQGDNKGVNDEVNPRPYFSIILWLVGEQLLLRPCDEAELLKHNGSKVISDKAEILRILQYSRGEYVYLDLILPGFPQLQKFRGGEIQGKLFGDAVICASMTKNLNVISRNA